MILPLTEFSHLLPSTRPPSIGDEDAGKLPPWMLRSYMTADEKAEMDREAFQQLYPERFGTPRPPAPANSAPIKFRKPRHLERQAA